jgi:(R)-2-hydroxyacyl-CoA dehydratese activating ATPase
MKTINIGIDLGSRMSKIVALQNNQIIYDEVTDTGVNPQKTATRLLENVLQSTEINRSGINKIFSTGYGRNIVPFADKRISEISCHAKGVSYYYPKARTVIDIGGQDSKAILLGINGKVIDFVMNDKCAAGTGRFLEVVANILEITVNDLQRISEESKEDIDINSTCVVFAESEIIGLIAAGKAPADIVKAIHRSIAKRIKNLIASMSLQKPVVFTGGVAQNMGMQKAIAKTLREDLLVPENSFITGALGAALLAAE